MNRRSLILAATALPFAAQAQSWAPDRALRMIIPVTPGGTADTVARMVAEPAGRILGQTIVVENRPGGGATLGAPIVARLNQAIVGILNDPASRARMEALGEEATPSTPEELAATLAAESARWKQVIEAAGIRAE